MRSMMLAMGTVMLGAGCLGGEPIEDESAGESAAGKVVTLIAERVIAWPKEQDSVSGYTRLVQQDASELAAAGDLVVFRFVDHDIQIELDSPWLQSVGDLRTNMGFVLLHRDRGNPNGPWASVTCGDEYDAELSRNGVRFFNDQTTVAMIDRTIETRTGSRSFADCGIFETSTELAVFVMPFSNVGNMQGVYEYDLWAACDGASCGHDRTYGPATIVNNPQRGGAQVAPERQQQRTPPPDPNAPRNVVAGQESVEATLRTYYAALGTGDIDAVVRLWSGLDDAAKARLRTIAAYGRGWSWTIELGQERRSNGDYSTNVEVIVTATKGRQSQKWGGTIDLVWQPSLQDPMRWGWYLTGMRLAQL